MHMLSFIHCDDRLVLILISVVLPCLVCMLGTVTVGGGKSPSVSITVEARMGNKVVTHIRGLDIFGIDMATFSKECSKKFAASSTIGPVNTNPKEKEIVIQVKKKGRTIPYACMTWVANLFVTRMIGSSITRGRELFDRPLSVAQGFRIVADAQGSQAEEEGLVVMELSLQVPYRCSSS
jgi:translation initiation factor 1 (eIF-1/SUI1)